MIKFIDLFAGLGSTRIGFEQACSLLGIKCQCVFTSEIKSHAVLTYENNFPGHKVRGDITQISPSEIPDFDYLLGGFPCQAFSAAGARRGFEDTRGTLFFDVARIIKEKKPQGFLLENVEGLVNHDKGRTLEIIMNTLRDLGYNPTWQVLNSMHFGVPQNRKRIYIVGHKNGIVDLSDLSKIKTITKTFKDIKERLESYKMSDFAKMIIKHYPVEQLHGKAIKDKRGGSNNIHSWDIGYRGAIGEPEKRLLDQLLKERRKKHRAEKKGIKRMDGMPLTYQEISSFRKGGLFPGDNNLQKILDSLVKMGYLKYEHPKDEVIIKTKTGKIRKRVPRTDIPKGYNIIVGKLSFPISKIIDDDGVSPTIVATDASRLAVVDGQGIRKLTILEGKRLFGIPDSYKMNSVSYSKAFDLLGNTVVVPVIREISKKIIEIDLYPNNLSKLRQVALNEYALF